MSCNLKKRSVTQLEIRSDELKIYWLFCDRIKFRRKFDSQFFKLFHRHDFIWRNHLVPENFTEVSFLIWPRKFAFLQTWLHSFAQSFYNLARKICVLISSKTERSSTIYSCLLNKFLVAAVPDTKRVYTCNFNVLSDKIEYLLLVIDFTIC